MSNGEARGDAGLDETDAASTAPAVGPAPPASAAGATARPRQARATDAATANGGGRGRGRGGSRGGRAGRHSTATPDDDEETAGDRANGFGAAPPLAVPEIFRLKLNRALFDPVDSDGILTVVKSVLSLSPDHNCRVRVCSDQAGAKVNEVFVTVEVLPASLHDAPYPALAGR